MHSRISTSMGKSKTGSPKRIEGMLFASHE